jgi:hypothetical protein
MTCMMLKHGYAVTPANATVGSMTLNPSDVDRYLGNGINTCEGIQ